MRFQMARRLLAQRPDPKGDPARALVTIELECGCVAERTVDLNRVLETIGADGASELLVAGKFLCQLHAGEMSGDVNEKDAGADSPDEPR